MTQHDRRRRRHPLAELAAAHAHRSSCRWTAARPIARLATRRSTKSSRSRARTSSAGRLRPRAPPARSTSASTGRLPVRCSANRVLADGATVPLDGNIMMVAEAEFAFKFARRLPKRANPYTQDEVLDAVESLHPAIEVPDSRYNDFAKVGAPQLIADTACAVLVRARRADVGRLALARSRRARGDGLSQRRTGRDRQRRQRARRSAHRAHVARQRAAHLRRRHRRRPVRHDRHLRRAGADQAAATRVPRRFRGVRIGGRRSLT